MSFVHVPEARTNGKILLKTTLGDIEVGLWTKECPKATRNFVQLCAEGYYSDNTFIKVIKNFIAITGDHTNTGEGGKSIYSEPFKDEIHSRLRFKKRGLLATANTDKNDNNSRFFFTLGPAEELQGKHTIFGKVLGDSIYNLIKLNECELDKDDKPVRNHKIISATIIDNPYPDIEIKQDPTNNDRSRCIDNKSRTQSNKCSSTSSSSASSDSDDERKKVIHVRKKRRIDIDDRSSSSGSDQPTCSRSNIIERISSKRLTTDHHQTHKAEFQTNKKARLDSPSCSSSNSDSNSYSSSSSDGDRTKNKARELELANIRSQVNQIKTELTQPSSKNTSGESNNLKTKKDKEEETIKKLEIFKNKLRMVSNSSKETKYIQRNESKKEKNTRFQGKNPADESNLDKIDSDDWLVHEFNADAKRHQDEKTHTEELDWYSLDDPRTRS